MMQLVSDEMSGKDFLKSHVLSWRRKVYSDWNSSGRAFHTQSCMDSLATPVASARRICSSVRPFLIQTQSVRDFQRGKNSNSHFEVHEKTGKLYSFFKVFFYIYDMEGLYRSVLLDRYRIKPNEIETLNKQKQPISSTGGQAIMPSAVRTGGPADLARTKLMIHNSTARYYSTPVSLQSPVQLHHHHRHCWKRFSQFSHRY